MKWQQQVSFLAEWSFTIIYPTACNHKSKICHQTFPSFLSLSSPSLFLSVSFFLSLGVRCSCVVERSLKVHSLRIIPHGGPIELFLVQTKAMECAILCRMVT